MNITQENIVAPISRTALGTASLKFAETLRPDRLIEDPYAEMLLAPSGRNIMGQQSIYSRPISSTRAVILRTRWMEDLIRNAAAFGITQIVNAACGLDTVAWRINQPQDLKYFELELPQVMQYKLRLLQNIPLQCNYIPMSVDLRDDSWPEKLIENGFDKTKKTLWITMGFLTYIPEEGVHKFLDRVNNLSAPGSLYTSDIVKHSNDPEVLLMYQSLKAAGMSIEFQTEAPEELFSRHKFGRTLQHLTTYEYAQKLRAKYSDDDTQLSEFQKNGTSLILVEKC